MIDLPSTAYILFTDLIIYPQQLIAPPLRNILSRKKYDSSFCPPRAICNITGHPSSTALTPRIPARTSAARLSGLLMSL